MKRQYFEAIIKAGGIPILLPNVEQDAAAKDLIDIVDGLMITGGPDIHPKYFGQKPHERLSRTTVARDKFELQAISFGLKKEIPILGVCRGLQVLNVFFGGTLYQDLSCIPHGILKHADPRQTGRVFHKVRIIEGSRLHRIVGRSSIEVNSSHHQAIDVLGEGLHSTAFCADGIIEGVEHNDFDFVIGVQWHPEGIYRRTASKKLFRAFVIESAARS